MPSIEAVRDWQGRTMIDRDGERVGKIQDIYLDQATDEPEWALVNTGLFGTKATFVPIRDAAADAGDVRVPFEKRLIKDAPRIEPDAELTAEEEDRLYQHYGFESAPHGDDAPLPAMASPVASATAPSVVGDERRWRDQPAGDDRERERHADDREALPDRDEPHGRGDRPDAGDRRENVGGVVRDEQGEEFPIGRQYPDPDVGRPVSDPVGIVRHDPHDPDLGERAAGAPPHLGVDDRTAAPHQDLDRDTVPIPRQDFGDHDQSGVGVERGAGDLPPDDFESSRPNRLRRYAFTERVTVIPVEEGRDLRRGPGDDRGDERADR